MTPTPSTRFRSTTSKSACLHERSFGSRQGSLFLAVQGLEQRTRHRKPFSSAHVLYCSRVRSLNERACAGSPPTQILWVTMCAAGEINLLPVLMLFGNCEYFETKLQWTPSLQTKSCLDKYQKEKVLPLFFFPLFLILSYCFFSVRINNHTQNPKTAIQLTEKFDLKSAQWNKSKPVI